MMLNNIQANKQVELFAEFKKNLTTRDETTKGGRKQPLRDIREEIELLQEVNDILDELNIVKSVLLSQASIMNEFAGLLATVVDEFERQNEETRYLFQTYGYCKTLSKIDLLHEQVDRLAHDAKEVQHNVSTSKSKGRLTTLTKFTPAE
jgi:hypothetical protein